MARVHTPIPVGEAWPAACTLLDETTNLDISLSVSMGIYQKFSKGSRQVIASLVADVIVHRATHVKLEPHLRGTSGKDAWSLARYVTVDVSALIGHSRKCRISIMIRRR